MKWLEHKFNKEHQVSGRWKGSIRGRQLDLVLPYLVLGILTLFFCWLFCWRYGIFGAKVDWISQHSVIPDYFRQQFYETGDLFPEYAANLGGGQNIYHFSYYGLYSPMILLSYLLPFVKMGDYIMVSGILCLMAAVMLLYHWLMKRGFSGKISFIAAFMYLLSGPMIFHSYNQIMFVNYMPFLCMAFLGVDRFFEKRRAGLYAGSVFLMIMTSFYFSIGGMLALVLYGMHRYLQIQEVKGDKVTFQKFLIEGIRFLVPMITAVLMSGVLLVPTAIALMARSHPDGSGEVNLGAGILSALKSLLIPDTQILRFVYSPYGIGLTTLAIAVLITGLAYRKNYERVLSYGCIMILTVPVFAYLLNGGLYIRDKAMIPMLPLICYLCAYYWQKQERRELSFAVSGIPFLLVLVILYLGKEQVDYTRYWKIIMADAVIMLFCLLIFWRKRDILLLAVPPIVFLTVFGNVFHVSADKMESREFYQEVTDQELREAIGEILEDEDGFYRMEQGGSDTENAANLNRVWNMWQYVSSMYSSAYNADYMAFRQEIFGLDMPYRNYLMQSVSKNPIWQRFMGVKYILSKEEEPGYELYRTIGNEKVWRNESVSPIAYATDRVISEEVYQQLEFPYNQTALLSYAVAGNVKENAKDDIKNTVKAEFKIPETDNEELRVGPISGGYQIHAEKKEKIQVKIQASTSDGTNSENIADASADEILFLGFKVKNQQPGRDIAIWLEGERNKLSARDHIYYNGNTTFIYAVVLDSNSQEAELTFGAGDYEITDIECCLEKESIESVEERSSELYQSEFRVDREETSGNRITGSVVVKRDGYFITTIPYDANYEIKIDGDKVDAEKVNMAFLGCKIGAGEHTVEITYHAPGINAGKIISFVGILMFVLLIIKRIW